MEIIMDDLRYTLYPAVHYTETTQEDIADFPLIGEEPLSIRVSGKPYSVVMRTPGDETAHVAGFCLAEGIADEPEDIASIAFCDGSDTNVVTVTLTPSRRDKIPEIIDRRNYVSQTSCGLCGKEMVKELYQILQPIQNNTVITVQEAIRMIDSLSDHQPMRRKTRAAHAAALCDIDGRILAMSEDVGRHNALDKSIGKLFYEKKLHEACVVVMSSRISYELVQKAARARIPIILAVSRPTALAAGLASELNMSIACLSKNGGLYVFCGKQRFKREK